MTQSIHRGTRERALAAPPRLRRRAFGRLVMGVAACAVAAGLGVAVFATLAVVNGGVHYVVGAWACAVLAGIGGALLCVRAWMSGQAAAYRQGELDGWVRGWNGQPPETQTPGLS